jgi:thiol-disulfide isomerase/thioredoxin
MRPRGEAGNYAAVPGAKGPVTTGLAVLLGALAVALLGGAGWRLTNGRMHKVRIPDMPPPSGHPSGSGRGKSAPDGAHRDGDGQVQHPAGVLSAEQLGQPLGERATLLQFSSAFCAPCRATRRILTDVAAMTAGVTHIEIDAESRLDLVRQLNVLRTPTVLVLAADGSVVRRASGQPRKPDVIAAIGDAVSEPIPTYMIGIEDSDSSSRPA